MQRNFDIENIAQAIKAGMGESLPDIRQALAEMKSGAAGRVTTPDQILMCQRSGVMATGTGAAAHPPKS